MDKEKVIQFISALEEAGSYLIVVQGYEFLGNLKDLQYWIIL